MTVEIKKVSKGYSLVGSNGNKIKKFRYKKDATAWLKSTKLEIGQNIDQIENVMLENGPVILGIAATNRPHLPLPRMSVVDVDGEQMIRVPFLRSGIFRHPSGNLVFNEKVFNKMLNNYTGRKSHYGVSLDIRHKPELGALAWFDEDKGGYIKQEDDNEFGKMLVAYGKPTSPESVDIINSMKYAYASVEFQPNHKDTLIKRILSDDMVELSLEDLILELESEMEDVTLTQEEYDGLKAKADTADELEVKLSEQSSKLVETETKLTEALKTKEVELEEVEEVATISEEVQVKLDEQQAEISRLKRNALETQVDLVLTRAQSYRDDSDKGHSPVLLEIARNAMLGMPVGTNDNSIKLESSEPGYVADYFRKVFVYMLENVPGQVKLEGVTVSDGDDTNGFELGEVYSEEIYKDFWAEAL